jgi:large conductance mechanosensitive channel
VSTKEKQSMSTWSKEFKEFISRGNLVELAVAFVLGVAFAALIASFVDDIVMQIVAAIVGEPDFRSLTFDLGDSVIRYGSFLTALINFLIIAFVLFLVVKAYNRFKKSSPDAGPTEVELLTQIRDALTRPRQ